MLMNFFTSQNITYSYLNNVYCSYSFACIGIILYSETSQVKLGAIF